MKTLIMTVGLPRSGKTTWARKQGHPIVCPDEIRLALHGQRFYSDAEPMVWAIAKVMVGALFGAGHDIVILDATNGTRERRAQWVDRQDRWRTQAVEFSTPVTECLRRAYETQRSDIYGVIDRMVEEWEPVAFGEECIVPFVVDTMLGQDYQPRVETRVAGEQHQ